jgi:invasion protein IalB
VRQGLFCRISGLKKKPSDRQEQAMKHALMVFSSLATYLVFGTSALEAANDPRAMQLTYEPWTKLCFGKKCFVAAGARGACYPSGGAVSIVTEDGSASLSVHLGTNSALGGAISVQVDHGATILIPDPECQQLGCGGKFDVDIGFIDDLKRSQMITIDATDKANQRISFSLPLADFAKAYDGPSAPLPKVVEETQEKLMEELARRAEEQKKLRCQE